MMWSYQTALYLRTHCVARGLSSLTIAVYEATPSQFRAWSEEHAPSKTPDRVVSRDVLAYLEHLRRERDNGASAANRAVEVLRSFYRAVAAMGHFEPRDNPLIGFPTVKKAPRLSGITTGLSWLCYD